MRWDEKAPSVVLALVVNSWNEVGAIVADIGVESESERLRNIVGFIERVK
jgi:hypothetical protein